MLEMLREVRQAIRGLRRSPGYSCAVILCLGLGIGGASSVYSVVHAILIRGLPYHEPDRLVLITEQNAIGEELSVAYPNYLDWRSDNESFADMAVFGHRKLTLSDNGRPSELGVGLVSASLFPVLHAEPALGRRFLDREDRVGGDRVVLLSHALWHSRFGGDPEIVGQPVTLNDVVWTVVGVMPAGFSFPPAKRELTGVAVWAPIGIFARHWSEQRDLHPGLTVIGRLRDGVSAEHARLDMERVTRALESAYPHSNTGLRARVSPLHEAVVQDVRRGLWLLFGSVAVLLLIACVNVANLQLVRGVAKQAEVAVRASVGATRWQIAKHLLAESAVLSVLGGMVGLWLTSVATYLFPLASAVLGPRVEQLGVDTAVISFAVALTLVVGVVFGLAPLLRASSASPAWVVGGAARRSTPVETLRLHRTLVAAEVGFALILLIGGGSLLKSLVALTQEELGMERDDVVSLQVSLRGERYASAAKRGQFFDALVQRADALPGVVSAAAIKPQPLSMQREGIPYEVEGVAPAPERPLMAELSYVSPAYFATIGIPLLAGRAFSERDSSQAPAVVIIDETLAARHWPGKDPLGKRIRTAGWDRSAPWMEVVGVVGHAKIFGFARTSWVQLYVPSAQRQPWSMAVMVRAETGHAAIATGLQDAAHALDPALPISSARTLTGYFDKSISSQRLWTVVLGLFAAVALLHASLGVYGVMAYSVAQRRPEIAIRIALGARSADVFRMISRQGIVPVMIGVGAGLAAGGALAPLLASQLHGVSPGDPITMAVSTIILCATSTVATLMPALKASRVDPGEMLRTE